MIPPIFAFVASVYILETSPDLLYAVTDTSGKVTKSNELFRQYTSHIQPNSITDIITDADRDDFIQAIERAKQTSPNPYRTYAQTRQKTGANRYNVWNIYLINSHLHFIGVQLFDVTSVTAHEHERLKQLIQDVAFMASHELRQPAASLKGLIELLKLQAADLRELSELIDMAKESVDKTDAAINQIVKRLTRQI